MGDLFNYIKWEKWNMRPARYLEVGALQYWKKQRQTIWPLLLSNESNLLNLDRSKGVNTFSLVTPALITPPHSSTTQFNRAICRCFFCTPQAGLQDLRVLSCPLLGARPFVAPSHIRRQIPTQSSLLFCITKTKKLISLCQQVLGITPFQYNISSLPPLEA